MFGRSKKLWNWVRRKKSVQILSVGDIAEELGVFPSDVEEAVKDLQERGLVHCIIAKGEIYVVFKEGASMEDIESYEPTPLDKNNVMFG